MTAFFSAGMPSAGVYRISPVFSIDEQLMIASIGVRLLGSPPPRWMTGSPLSLSRAAVSLSLRVGDSLMDNASWLSIDPPDGAGNPALCEQRCISQARTARRVSANAGRRCPTGLGIGRLPAAGFSTVQ